jgi:peptidoglycan/xylan/chitin deacetylase (PgdA/CDA1 family)
MVRGTAATVLGAAGVPARRRRSADRALTVLCYHRVLPQEQRAAYPFSDLAVTPEAFAEHVAHCAKHYTCLPLGEAAALLMSDSLPAKPLLAITFDDGYWDNAAYAQPVLDACGVRATFFVVSGLVGASEATWYDRYARARAHLQVKPLPAPPSDEITCGPRTLSGQMQWVKKLSAPERLARVEQVVQAARSTGWRPDDSDRIMNPGELRTIAAAGHEIGSHTVTHPILPLLNHDECAAELRDSRRMLQELVNQPVDTLAYPNGDYDESVLSAARQCGFRFAVTTESGGNAASSDPLRLARYVVLQQRMCKANGDFSSALFDLEMTGLADDLFRRTAGETKPAAVSTTSSPRPQASSPT